MQVNQIMQVTQIMQVNQNMQVNQKKNFESFQRTTEKGSNYRIPVHYCILEAASF